MGPQLAVAGVGTSKFSVGTNGAIHAIIFSSLTQVLHLFTTSSCPRRPHHQFSHCNYFSIPYVLSQHFRYFWFISSHFFSIFLIQVHCGSAFEPGASWLPHYCTPPVCVPDVIRGLAVWRHTNKKKKGPDGQISSQPVWKRYVSFFLSWVANTQHNHWNKVERLHYHFACPNFF